MAARAGMVDIIAALRGETDAEENATTVNGVAYWTDDQLQEILDTYSHDVLVQLQATPRRVNGTTSYTRYYVPSELHAQYVRLESSETTGAFILRTSTGYEVDDSTYTYYPFRNLIEFTSSQSNRTFILEARAYSIANAAAHVWNMKADFRTKLITIKAGNHALNEDQEFLHCIQMRDFYRKQRGLVVTTLKGSGYAGGMYGL